MSEEVVHTGIFDGTDDRDIVAKLSARFDPRIVFPDELSREAVAEIERLRSELAAIRARVHDAWLRDPGEGNPHEATGDDLIDRLRGVYTIPVNDGAGPLNGSTTFTRKFPPLPLSVEAAKVIAELRSQKTS